MTNLNLLDRQVDLLRYLTDPGLIFGGNLVASAAEDPNLRGIDIPRLRLEAEMSFGKRISKIGKLLKLTYLQLGPAHNHLFRAFVSTCRPASYRRYEDAVTFYRFLQNLWQECPPSPPFLPDLVRVELALARARTHRADVSELCPSADLDQKKPLVRLCAGAEILAVEYDLRPLFETSSASNIPQRPAHILVAPLKRRRAPGIVEVPEGLGNLLASLKNWTPLSEVAEHLNCYQSETLEIWQLLLRRGVVEIVE